MLLDINFDINFGPWHPWGHPPVDPVLSCDFSLFFLLFFLLTYRRRLTVTLAAPAPSPMPMPRCFRLRRRWSTDAVCRLEMPHSMIAADRNYSVWPPMVGVFQGEPHHHVFFREAIISAKFCCVFHTGSLMTTTPATVDTIAPSLALPPMPTKRPLARRRRSTMTSASPYVGRSIRRRLSLDAKLKLLKDNDLQNDLLQHTRGVMTLPSAGDDPNEETENTPLLAGVRVCEDFVSRLTPMPMPMPTPRPLSLSPTPVGIGVGVGGCLSPPLSPMPTLGSGGHHVRVSPMHSRKNSRGGARAARASVCIAGGALYSIPFISLCCRAVHCVRFFVPFCVMFSLCDQRRCPRDKRAIFLSADRSSAITSKPNNC